MSPPRLRTVNHISSPHRLSPPTKIVPRVAAVLAGLVASYGIAHAEGLAPTAVQVSQTPTSACQSGALHIGFQIGDHDQVTALIDGLTPPCFDKPYRLTVVGPSGAVIYTATGRTASAGSTAVPVAVAPADVTAITMAVTG